MKRSAALASLSRDHHQALVVAQQLRRADAERAEPERAEPERAKPERADAERADAARKRFLTYWGEHGRLHFRLEEEVLLPAYAAHGDAHEAVVLRVLGDHVAIRQRAARLARAAAPDPGELRELGELLAAHVRLEERELFPMIEAALPADGLAALADALERAEAAAASGASDIAVSFSYKD